MVPQGERGEEVAFDVDVAPEVGFDEAQWVAPEHHGRDDAWVAANQREARWGLRTVHRVAEHQRGAAPQAQREAPVEAAKQTR